MHKTTPKLLSFSNAYGHDAIRIWNAAAHADYPINESLLFYNLIPMTGERVEGCIATLQEKAVGFVLACAFPQDPLITLGWISAIAVEPSVQRKGIGSALLMWAEAWLKENGCKRIRIGGNYRPFLPGLPYGMRDHRSVFEKHGYKVSSDQPFEYDVARSLKDYKPLYPKPAYADLAPMQPGEEQLLLDFMHREYPGRWEFEARESVKNRERVSDILLLRVNGDVQGFCRLTLEDSQRPLERFYPQRLPKPWGQFGALGLSEAVRGQGLGAYLIDAAAVHLQLLGVDGCVIDWTSLIELYGKFGFKIYNQYISLFKSLQDP